MSLKYYERERLSSFLIALYGKQVAGKWEPNEKVLGLVLEMLDKSGQCSGLMDWVPRPINMFSSPLKALGREAIKKILKSLKDRENDYVICLAAAKYRFRGRLDLAGRGL